MGLNKQTKTSIKPKEDRKAETKNRWEKQKKNSKTKFKTNHIIITLNVNGLTPRLNSNILIFNQNNEIKLHTAYIQLYIRNPFQIQTHIYKKVCHVNPSQKKAGVAILIYDKVDYRSKKMIRDKNHVIMTKG